MEVQIELPDFYFALLSGFRGLKIFQTKFGDFDLRKG